MVVEYRIEAIDREKPSKSIIIVSSVQIPEAGVPYDVYKDFACDDDAYYSTGMVHADGIVGIVFDFELESINKGESGEPSTAIIDAVHKYTHMGLFPRYSEPDVKGRVLDIIRDIARQENNAWLYCLFHPISSLLYDEDGSLKVRFEKDITNVVMAHQTSIKEYITENHRRLTMFEDVKSRQIMKTLKDHEYPSWWQQPSPN